MYTLVYEGYAYSGGVFHLHRLLVRHHRLGHRHLHQVVHLVRVVAYSRMYGSGAIRSHSLADAVGDPLVLLVHHGLANGEIDAIPFRPNHCLVLQDRVLAPLVVVPLVAGAVLRRVDDHQRPLLGHRILNDLQPLCLCCVFVDTPHDQSTYVLGAHFSMEKWGLAA